ncbi:Protein argonaute-2 [Blastocladiella emersonii ATCC 22665]|nr:Protein argonaute-2 [Blastocladiella emersonii ATCC 22665]
MSMTSFTLGPAPFSTRTFVRRPGVGKVGTPVKVLANHYALSLIDNITVFHYDVVVTPEPTKSLARKVWAEWETQHGAKLGITAAYDGVKNVFVPKQLPQDTMTFTVALPATAEGKRAKEFKMTLKLASSINLSELSSFLDKRTSLSNNVLTSIMALDVVFRQTPLQRMLPAGRSFFDPKSRPFDLGGGLNLLSGLFMSVRPGVGTMTLNTDTAYTAFYKPIRMVDFARELLGRAFPPASQELSPRDLVRLEKMVRLLVVTATHRGALNPRFRVLKLTRTSANNTKFTLSPNAPPPEPEGIEHEEGTVPAKGSAKGAGKGGAKGGAPAKGAAGAGAGAAAAPPQSAGGKKGAKGAGAAAGGGVGAAAAGIARMTVGGKPREVTVLAYMSETYQIKLQFPNLPCLVVGTPQRQTYLPMELAIIDDGQKYRGKLTEDQTSNVIKVAAKKPLERMAQLKQLIATTANMGGDPYLKAFGVKVWPDLMAIQGRFLSTPKLQIGGNKTTVPRDGAWNFTNARVTQGARISAVGVVSFADPRYLPEDRVEEKMDELFDMCESMGLAFNPNKKTKTQYPIRTARAGRGGFGPEAIKAAMDEIYRETEATFGQRPDLIVVILPRKETPLYAEVKRVGDIELGCPTQCLVQAKIDRANGQYWANVVLKINVKVLGTGAAAPNTTNFALAQSKYFGTDSVMLIGADVSHPAPGAGHASLASMVASMDPKCAGRYSAEVRAQPSRQEEIADVRGMFAALLRRYHTANNKTFPKKIVFYRDGVSEGQFDIVLKGELEGIRSVLKKAGAYDQTRITFVTVQKRHHTRFFATNPSDNDRSGNLKAGLVVDTGVTHPTDFDFFLQSQAGLQGTSRPTRYVVLHDENIWTADDLQLFTYHLCYTYARCTRSVSVAPPAYYAHLVSFRSRHHLLSTETGSDTASVSTSRSGEKDSPAAELAKVHANLTASMYYM